MTTAQPSAAVGRGPVPALGGVEDPTGVLDVVEVVVPVHDEEDLLPHCLRGLQVACRRAGAAGIRAAVTVVLDACSDGSAALVAAAGVRAVRIDRRNVGAARAAGFDSALAACSGLVGLDRIWLATTDADSVVPPDWLTGQLAYARAGADMVLGTVTIDDWSGWPTATARHYLARYDSSSATPHPHVHGANLGIRATHYRDIGGFAALATAEDRALLAAATAAGGRIVRVRDLAVGTSARATARAPLGFSDHLHQLTDLR